MYEYDEECLKTFILNQGQLFDEPVAETLEEAEAFLEDCMASIALKKLKNSWIRREWISAECLMKRSKRHRKYLHFQMDVILSLRVKIRTRTKESKRKSRDYFVVSAFFSAFSMA